MGFGVDEVDVLARRLAPPAQSAAEAEMMKRRLLASLPPRRGPRSGLGRAWWPPVRRVALAAVLAAGVVAVIRTPAIAPAKHAAANAPELAPAPAGPPPSWIAGPTTRFTSEVSGGAALLHLGRGELAIEVPAGAAATVIADRFVVASAGGRFAIAATERSLTVHVIAGHVVIAGSGARWIRQAGEIWTEVWDLPAPAPATGNRRPRRARPAPPAATEVAAAPAPAPDPAATAPGLAEFRTGRALTARGEHAAAHDAYRTAAARSSEPAIVEEAEFWAAVSAHRARSADARGELAAFVTRYPRSARRGQVALLLGQRAAAGGDAATARTWLQIAADDPLREVAAPAAALLEQLAR